MGRSEMFFPNADAHDLKLANMDGTYRARMENDYTYYGNNQAAALNFVDNGRNLVAPACDTTNLAFREFTYLQTSDALKGIRCTASKSGGGYVVSLTNGSSQELVTVQAFTPGARATVVEKVTPGQTTQLRISAAQLAAKPPKSGDQALRLANGQALPIYVQFGVKGLRVGPGWGEMHPGSNVSATIHPVVTGGQQ